MTRIVFAIPGDLATPSGGYGYDRRMLAELPQQGVEVAHLALPGSFPEPRPSDVAETAAVINREASAGDVILFDGLAYGALPRYAIHPLSAPIVALCHHPLCLETGLSPERANALQESERQALTLAAHIIVTSAHTKATLVSEFGLESPKITVAPPGADPTPRARGSGGAITLLAVGSIIPRKAFDLLVAALADLKDLDWRLRIVGSLEASSQTRRALERQIEETGLSSRIVLLGALSAELLDAVYHESDAFVSTSLHEGYGMALAEALARGLPILTTTGGAASETVPDGAALKVAPGDVNALKTALRSLLSDRALREEIAEESWRAGQRLPRWADTARIIAEVTREVGDRR